MSTHTPVTARLLVVTDQFGRRWAPDTGVVFGGAYRTENTTRTLLCDPTDLCGNAFEWCWAHTRATGLARRVLLSLAFSDTDPHTRPGWPGYQNIHQCCRAGSDRDLRPVEEAVLELVTLEELALTWVTGTRAGTDLSLACPAVTYTFPAYAAWCDQEVTR